MYLRVHRGTCILVLCFCTMLSFENASAEQAKYVIETACPDSYGVEIADTTGLLSDKACGLWCSVHGTCRSFLFYPTSGQCRLNEGIANTTTLPQDCVAQVVYGRLEKIILSDCDSNATCPVTNSYCYHEKCSCIPGYSYHPTSDACVTECYDYGTDFMVQIGRLLYAHSGGDKSLDECKTICVEYTSATCRSVIFWKGVTFGQCYYSNETALTYPDQYYISESDTYITYFRNCA